MPTPLLAARGAFVAAAGGLLALAAMASLTAAHSDPVHGRAMVRGGEAMAMGHPAAFWFGKPGKVADVDRTIRVKAMDLSFDPPDLAVKAGETVRFVVTNQSEVEHEFTIGDTKTQREHREEMAEMTDMAAAHAHDDDPNAVFLNGGETREIVWRFARAGQIEFGCNVPGHYEAGMKGTIAIR